MKVTIECKNMIFIRFIKQIEEMDDLLIEADNPRLIEKAENSLCEAKISFDEAQGWLKESAYNR